MKFTVLGAGAYGTALGNILKKDHHEVTYYDVAGLTLEDALDGAEAMVLCVPSGAVPELLPRLPKDLPLIVATKGLLGAGIFSEFSDVMAMSGAGFAADIEAEKPTALVITDRRLYEWFHQPWLSLVESSDLNGVLLCGALKNVYAIGAGLRNLEEDSHDWYEYTNAAVEELSTILVANGSSPRTATLPCGRDDIELTCAMPSRNYEFGVLLSVDPSARPTKTVEGVTTIMRLRQGEIVVPDEAVILKQLMEKVKWN